METKTFIATTETGKAVYMCSDTYEHMMAHPDVRIEDVKEAVERSDYVGPFKMASVNLGRTVGKDGCIRVPEGMTPHMLFRKGRDGKTPVFFEGEAEAADTSLVTIGICTDDDGLETVFTAFYGQLAPKEPWDPRQKEQERKESEEFWRSHALVVSQDSIDLDRS